MPCEARMWQSQNHMYYLYSNSSSDGNIVKQTVRIVHKIYFYYFQTLQCLTESKTNK